ncbi:MAG: hypothetical protein KDA57_17325 [Planctomycetales bacterium]|nr:hypothetical protein [Planctomycetales bacterium]
MISCVSSLLILAALSGATSDDRHVDAIEIYSCDFNEKDFDKNFDQWPDGWTRRRGEGWPHYVKINLENAEKAVAGRCLTVYLNGGSAEVSSRLISVSEKFSYVVEARILTSQLINSRAQVRIDFLDENRETLESAPSRWFKGTNDWTKIHVGPVSIDHPDVRYAKISLYVAQEGHVDLEGRVSLDDIWLARMPRMTVRTNSPYNVYTDPRNVVVTCDLSGILEKDPDIRFELLNASSLSLDDSTVQLEGRLITERLDKASDIVNSSISRPSGFEGSTQWKPPIQEFGFYRVHVSMQTSRGTLKKNVISIAVVPPIKHHSRGEFGWSLAGDDLPLSLDHLAELLPRVGINWVKLPVWYGTTEPQRGDELIRFSEQLVADDVEVVGVLDKAPSDIDFGKAVADDISIADLLSGEDPSAWLPSLDAVLTRLSLRVRWWQLGNDRDSSYSDFHHLEKELSTLRGQLFRFGQDVNLGIGWPWNKSSTTAPSTSWDFQQHSATPALTSREIASYLDLPRPSGVARWMLIEPLSREYYDLETRTKSLVQQMLAAKIHGAEGIFIAEPFDDDHGLMSDTGTPTELLLPWRTTASLLSGTTYLGTLRLAGGSENRLFETAEGEVLMVVWNESPRQEAIYLGDNVRVIDAWGRSKVPEQDGHRQLIEVDLLPKFILGLNPQIAKWRMDARFVHENIPSVFGSNHSNAIEIRNPFEQGAGGFVRLVPPDGWQVSPEKVDFKLSAGERSERPFQIALPFDANSGNATVRADFEFTADQPYRFSIYRELIVGDEDIEIELHTRLAPDGSLMVEQRMINHSDKLLDFKCLLYTAGRRRQRIQVFRLGNNHDVKTYAYQNGKELVGQELWLRAEELGGTRILNHRIMIDP